MVTDTCNRSLFAALRTILHIIAAAQIIYGIVYIFVFINPPPGYPDSSHLEKLCYFTVLNAVCVFVLCILFNVFSALIIFHIFHCFNHFVLQIWQAVYFTLCIVTDFIGANECHPKQPSAIRKFKDYVFAAFAFPLALIVATTFWILYAIDRELILPKYMDEFFPVWVRLYISMAFCDTRICQLVLLFYWFSKS